MTDEFLTITQLAVRLGVTEKVIKGYMHADGIPYVKIGSAVRFRWSAVDAWISTLPGSHPATMPATPSAPKGISTVPPDTVERPISLLRGPRGRNRQELAKG